MVKPKIVLLIFVSGKVVLTGGKVRVRLGRNLNRSLSLTPTLSLTLILLLAFNRCITFTVTLSIICIYSILVLTALSLIPKQTPALAWPIIARRAQARSEI